MHKVKGRDPIMWTSSHITNPCSRSTKSNPNLFSEKLTEVFCIFIISDGRFRGSAFKYVMNSNFQLPICLPPTFVFISSDAV